jgi:hypothetical protein
LLATIIPLVAHILPDFLVPSLFRVTYTPDELLLLIALLAGTVVGVSRKLPAWSYTWVVLTLGSIVAFLTSFLPTMLFDVMDFGAVTYGWLFTIIHLVGGIFVLIFAASLAPRGLSHPFFIAAVYLVSIALRVFLLGASNDISVVELIAANSFTIFVTALELGVVLAAVAHYLAGNAVTQQRSIYVLLAVALLDPLFAGWGLAIASAGTGDLVNVVGVLVGLPVLVRWVYIGVTLLLTWVLVNLLLKLRNSSINTLSPSGEAHAC